MTYRNRFLRGIKMAFTGAGLPDLASQVRVLHRRVTMLTIAVLVAWFLRAAGGPTHNASVYSAETGMAMWFASIIIFGAIEAGRLPRNEEPARDSVSRRSPECRD